MELLGTLIEKGAALDVQNNVGDTALICAAYSGLLDEVRLLVRAGANLEATGEGA